MQNLLKAGGGICAAFDSFFRKFRVYPSDLNDRRLLEFTPNKASFDQLANELGFQCFLYKLTSTGAPGIQSRFAVRLGCSKSHSIRSPRQQKAGSADDKVQLSFSLKLCQRRDLERNRKNSCVPIGHSYREVNAEFRAAGLAVKAGLYPIDRKREITRVRGRIQAGRC